MISNWFNASVLIISACHVCLYIYIISMPVIYPPPANRWGHSFFSKCWLAPENRITMIMTKMTKTMKTMMTTTKVHVEELHVQQQLFCSNKNMYTFSNFHWCCLLGHDEGRASSYTYCGHVVRTLQEKGFVLHEMFQEDVSKFTIFSVTQENQHRFSHSHKL